MPGLRQQPYRRFALTLVGFVALVVVVFTGLNTWINPLWVTPAPWTNPEFSEWRPVYRYQRTAKAGMIRAESWDAAFFGSSRIDIALDPSLPEWGDTRAVNLAVSAGTLPETSGILHYTLQDDPLEIAVVGIDLGDLMGGGSGIRSTGYMESPFNEKGDAFERELRYLAGISTFESSIKTLTNRAEKELPEYTPQGHRLRHQEPENVERVIYRDSIPHALRTIRRRRVGIEPHPWKVDCFQRILDDTKEAGTRLVVVIPPNHSTYIGVYHHANDIDRYFMKDRTLMVEMVEASNQEHPDAPPAIIWDFNDFHPLNCEPIPRDGSRMHWWLDGTHARKALGDVMLARIMGWHIEDPESRTYGMKLTRETLDQRPEQIRQGYLRFKEAQPDDWKWMVDAADAYQSTGEDIPAIDDTDAR